MTCDFTMITLNNNPDSVMLRLTVVNDKVLIDYQGQQFEVMQINVSNAGLRQIVFRAEQPSTQVQAQGRHWCRSDDDPWEDFTQSGNMLSYTCAVPDQGDVGYEMRFSVEGWQDPKVIISRKGQKV